MKNRLIPFSWLPASWGLRDVDFKKAEARYLYDDGYELDLRLVEIEHVGDDLKRGILDVKLKHGVITPYDYDCAMLKIEALEGVAFTKRHLELEHSHGIINDFEFDIAIAELIEDEDQRRIEVLNVQAAFGAIDPFDAEKEIATLRGEPWIRVVDDGLAEAEEGEDAVDRFFFEFDWNDLWIEKLIAAGYSGATEAAIVDQWFDHLCRTQASISMGTPINGGIHFPDLRGNL